MIERRPFDPNELGDADGFEVVDAMAAANRLSDALDAAPIQPSEGFADAVMAAIGNDPAPGTTGFLVPLRRRGIVAGFGESVRQAWASVRGGRPAPGRAAALAYVLVVAIAGVSLTGAATLGAAGALGFLEPAPTESPVPSPVIPEPTIAPEPTMAPSPTADNVTPTIGPSPSPTASPDDSNEPDDNSGPGGGDGDDNSGPGGGDGDDNSGPGGGDGDDNSGPGGGGSSGPG